MNKAQEEMAKMLHQWGGNDVNAVAGFELPDRRLLMVTSRQWIYEDGLLTADLPGICIMLLDPGRLVYAHLAGDDGEEGIQPKVQEEARP